MTTADDTPPLVIPERREVRPEERRWRWSVYAMLVMLALTNLVTLVLLVDSLGDRGKLEGQVTALNTTVAANAQAATAERTEQAARLERLTAVIAALTRSNSGKDAEIKRLTDLLIKAGIDVGTPVPGSRQPSSQVLSSTKPSAIAPRPAVRPSPTAAPTKKDLKDADKSKNP